MDFSPSRWQCFLKHYRFFPEAGEELRMALHSMLGASDVSIESINGIHREAGNLSVLAG
jgi:hypothetical protein